MLLAEFLAKTCLSKVNEYFVINMLSPDYICAALFFHAVKQRVKLFCGMLSFLGWWEYFSQVFSQIKGLGQVNFWKLKYDSVCIWIIVEYLLNWSDCLLICWIFSKIIIHDSLIMGFSNYNFNFIMSFL